jgi:hypothetical protein
MIAKIDKNGELHIKRPNGWVSARCIHDVNRRCSHHCVAFGDIQEFRELHNGDIESSLKLCVYTLVIGVITDERVLG